jgi:hypothetical protein
VIPLTSPVGRALQPTGSTGRLRIILSACPNLGSIGGLQAIDGKGIIDSANPTTFRPSLLKNGHRYQMTIKVRATGDDATVEAFLDNQRIVQWRGKSASLSPISFFSMPDSKKAGFGHMDAVTLYAARMRRL